MRLPSVMADSKIVSLLSVPSRSQSRSQQTKSTSRYENTVYTYIALLEHGSTVDTQECKENVKMYISFIVGVSYY